MRQSHCWQDVELLTPMHWAVLCNHAEHVHFLLKKLKVWPLTQ